MKDAVLFIGGALVSWLIARWYYAKANADQRDELGRLRAELRPRNSLLDFERLLVAGSWEKKVVDNQETWVCKSDGTYQVQLGKSGREFSEPWTAVHPDNSCQVRSVYLKIGSTTIHELQFVSADGGRILVPVTKIRRLPGGGVEYYWPKNGLEVKVCRVIGEYYIHKTLEELAEVSNVFIENDDA